jgi:Skp family chaperone for outer membrane proteins
MERIRKSLFPLLIALSALSVSISAAYYSVSGLSKLFAGASFAVMIMAGSLEAAKLVIASLLHQYWTTINKLLRAYLTVSVVILILITSMGIYGFLTSAYQETYQGLAVAENKVTFLEEKAKFYQDDVNRYDKELERISENIATLSNAKATGIQLRAAQARIKVEETNRKEVNASRTVAADSLQTYKLRILELENSTETSGELGPLKYIAGLTGVPMDKIINILILVIVFVFDPLAIALVVSANFAFQKAFPKREKNLYGEFEDEVNTPNLFDIEDEIPLTKSGKPDKRYGKVKELISGSMTEEQEKELEETFESPYPATVPQKFHSDVDQAIDEEKIKVVDVLSTKGGKKRIVDSKGNVKEIPADDNSIRYM